MKRKILLAVMSAMIVVACAPTAQPTAVPTSAPTKQPQAAATAAAPIASPTAQPTAKAAAPTPTAKSDKPKTGGILRMTQTRNPPNFDTHQNSTIFMLFVVAPAYDMLVQRDPKELTKVVPDLAERWEVANDGLTYTFYLRKGVLFHDGVEFTSDDAKASLDRIYNPPAGVVSIRSGSFSSIKSVDAVDKYTVRITLKRVQASLLPLLSVPYQQMFPKHILDKKGHMKEDVVGTGPFTLKAYKPGVSWEMAKNPKYFSPLAAGQPYLDGLMWFIIPDASTAFAALRTGQVDYQNPAAADLKTLQDSKSPIVSQPVPNKNGYILGYNMTKPPFSDPLVRRAANLAIDRAAGIQVIAQGQGSVGGYELPGSEWALPKSDLEKQEGYGPDKAKEIALAKDLLSKAGFATGFKTTLMSRQGEDAPSVFFKDQLAKIGIDATIIFRDDPAYYNSLAEKSYDTYYFANGYSLADPDTMLGEWVVPGAGRNYEGYNNPTLVGLYEKQSQTLDPQARKAIVTQMQQILHTDVPRSMLYWGIRNEATWPYVKGKVVQVDTMHLDLLYAHVWLDK